MQRSSSRGAIDHWCAVQKLTQENNLVMLLLHKSIEDSLKAQFHSTSILFYVARHVQVNIADGIMHLHITSAYNNYLRI